MRLTATPTLLMSLTLTLVFAHHAVAEDISATTTKVLRGQAVALPIASTPAPSAPATRHTIGPLEGQLFIAQTNPAAPACVCTNLANVTVICESCDRETEPDLCHLHDRACADAAQMGGIRESDTFFCTTASP